MKNFILSWGFLILASFLDSFTLYAVKWRSNTFGQFEPGGFSEMKSYLFNFLNHPVVWAGIVSFAFGLILGYIAVTRMAITIAYPASVGMHIIIVFLFGTMLLDESVTAFKMAGVFLIMTGIWLLSR